MVEIDQDKRGSNQLTGASPGFSFGKALSCENNYDDNWLQGCYRQGCHLVKLDRRWKELNVWHLTSIMIIVIIVMMMMIVKTTSSWWPPAREDSALQSTTGMNLFAPGVHFYGSSSRALYVREVSMKKAGHNIYKTPRTSHSSLTPIVQLTQLIQSVRANPRP